MPPPIAEDEADSDPGVVILFASDDDIHAVLGLSSIPQMRLPHDVLGILPLAQGKEPIHSEHSLHLLLHWDITMLLVV